MTLDTLKTERQHWVVRIARNQSTAWLVLASSLLLTLFAWRISSNFSERLAAERFGGIVREMIVSIDHRMHLYEQALWGGVGLYSASREVTRSEWRMYVDSLRVADALPGIQGMGVAVYVKESNRAGYQECVRSDGFPDFKIKPEGKRDIYAPVTYLEPFDWRNQRAFGYDMWSNSVRQEALSRARDLGVAATSGAVHLAQETDADIQNGFLT